MAHVKIAAAAENWQPNFGEPSHFKLSPEEILAQMQEIGFTGTELDTDLLALPWIFRQRMHKYGIQQLGGAVATNILTTPPIINAMIYLGEAVVLKILGGQILPVKEDSFSTLDKSTEPMFAVQANIPAITDAQWQQIADGFARLHRIAKFFGLEFCVHPHFGSLIFTEKSIDKLMSLSPEVPLLIDTAHCAMAGIDIPALIEKYIDRTVHFHLQDLRTDIYERARVEKLTWEQALNEGLLTTAGHGEIDFEPIVNAISTSDYDGWVVLEGPQNPTTFNPFEYNQSAYEYIHKLTNWT